MAGRLPAVLVALALVPGAVLAGPAGGGRVPASGPVVYQPPVDAPLVDRFRPPRSPFGAGNRGIDYATVEGTPVRAAASGEVVFAGQVGGQLHVVVLHADGIRTSYSFLATVLVRRGDQVEGGSPVGVSGSSLHFGARRGDEYIDPLTLFGSGGRVHLVPDRPTEPTGTADASSEGQRAGPGPQLVPGAAVEWARSGR